MTCRWHVRAAEGTEPAGETRILSFYSYSEVFASGLAFLFCPMDSKDDAIKSSSCEELSASDQGGMFA